MAIASLFKNQIFLIKGEPHHRVGTHAKNASPQVFFYLFCININMLRKISK